MSILNIVFLIKMLSNIKFFRAKLIGSISFVLYKFHLCMCSPKTYRTLTCCWADIQWKIEVCLQQEGSGVNFLSGIKKRSLLFQLKLPAALQIDPGNKLSDFAPISSLGLDLKFNQANKKKLWNNVRCFKKEKKWNQNRLNSKQNLEKTLK